MCHGTLALSLYRSQLLLKSVYQFGVAEELDLDEHPSRIPGRELKIDDPAAGNFLNSDPRDR